MKNKSIDVVKCMFHDLDFPTFLWVEECCTNVYRLNWCPHRVL
jgi:hypothetical protein